VFDSINQRITKFFWNLAVRKKYGFASAHLNVHYYDWHWATWKKDEMRDLVSLCGRGENNNDAGVIYFSKLLAEIEATDRNTTIRPKKTINVNQILPMPILVRRKNNKLTTVGMIQMAKNDVGGYTQKTWTDMQVGNNNTGETEGDQQLGNKLLSRAFLTHGSKTVITSASPIIERGIMPFPDSAFGASPPYIIKEGGIASGPNPPTDVLFTRVTFPQITINAAEIATGLITVGHQNGS
jgi:hypothetical protein